MGHYAEVSIITIYFSKRSQALQQTWLLLGTFPPPPLLCVCLGACFQVCYCMWLPSGNFLGLEEVTLGLSVPVV